MQGISVYSRPGRPTWYVAYDCPMRARRVNESSGIPLDDPRGKTAAYSYAREKSQSGIAHGAARDASRWENWVETWIRMRFAGSQRTLGRYLGSWKFLRGWLHANKVPTPRALTYAHALAYVGWREGQVKKSGRKVSRNTALMDCKIMSRIMRQAVRRGFSQGNPWFRLSEDIPSTPAPEKPELTNQMIADIRSELQRRAAIGRPSEWMPIAFEIALHLCCRLSATQIPMERIDFARGTVQLHEKGGAIFTVPIHPALRPLLERLRDEGRTVTCTIPQFASRNFTRLLRAMGLPRGYSFHCTRVTGITRMARAGIPEQQAMAAVHHGSWAVHKVYQRLKPADLRGVHAALEFGSVVVTGPGRQQNRDESRASAKALPGSSSGRKKSIPPSLGLRAAG